MCAACYIPPETSKYANRNAFREIAETLVNLDSENIMILGDMNARTGTVPDFQEDEYEGTGELTMRELIEIFDIKLTRNTKDTSTNGFCEQLIELCKCMNLLIVNGRVKGDLDGNLTCKETSLIDYFLATPYMFSDVVEFTVGEFDRCISDVHCPLFVQLKYQCNSDIGNQTDNVSVSNQNNQIKDFRPIWNQEKADNFRRYLDSKDTRNLTGRINAFLDNVDNVTQQNVDSVAKDIVNIFIDAAKASDMCKPVRKKVSNSVRVRSKHNFFDRDCRQRRADYRRAKRYCKRVGTEEARQLKRAAFSIYSSTVRKKSNQARRNRHTQLRRLKSTNPKVYWKHLNDWTNSASEENNMPSHEDFVQHFESLGNVNEDYLLDVSNEDDLDCPDLNTDILNNDILEDEIKKHISKLRNNKASGCDKILNEFLKSSSVNLIHVLQLFMNMVLRSGHIPEDWSIGTIRPLYKGKGDSKNVDNYRGITLLSCFGKLFTSILNERIYTFLDENKLLGKEQGGYRKGQSTTQHIFSLHSLINMYLQKKKKLYCLFVDYRKAYDKIQRNILWEKLLRTGIKGNILNIIKDMYSKAKSCVKSQRQGTSQFFTCNLGLRQGENLSPVLFSLFLNDLKDYLATKITGLQVPLNFANISDFEDVESFMHLFILLYADDTAILTETPIDMQKSLDALSIYCTTNGLSINVDKTKVIVFSRGKIRNIPEFHFDGVAVEVVFEYKYLGTIFSYNNKFMKAIKAQCTSANKASFSLLKKCRKLDLPLDIKLDLFDKCIMPILLYGSEIWSFENIDLLDREQLRFYKMILNVKKTTPTCMIYGELGKYPVTLYAKSRMLCFWYSLCLNSRENSEVFANILLRLNYKMNESNTNVPWLTSVHNLLDRLGLTYIHRNHAACTLTLPRFKSLVMQRLKDIYLQYWHEQVQTNEVCLNYRIFKTDFTHEKYLLALPYSLRQNLIRFRLSAHKLPIQQQRYMNIPRHERKCFLCDLDEIGDEYHYLFRCTHQTIIENRLKFIPKYYRTRPNILKFRDLLNSKSKSKLIKISRFISLILEFFK